MENQIRALTEQIRRFQIALGQGGGDQSAPDGPFIPPSHSPAYPYDQYLRNPGPDLHQIAPLQSKTHVTQVADQRDYSRQHLLAALQQREETSHDPNHSFNFASRMDPGLGSVTSAPASPFSFGQGASSSPEGAGRRIPGWEAYASSNKRVEHDFRQQQLAKNSFTSLPPPALRQSPVQQSFDGQLPSIVPRERAQSIANPISTGQLLSTATPEALTLASFEHLSSGHSLSSLFGGLNLNNPSVLVPVAPQGGLRYQRSSPDLHRQPVGPSPNNKKVDLYKTELCRSWEEKGSCAYEE